MRLTIRGSATGHVPYAVECTWPQLLTNAFSSHVVHGDKLSAPLLYPTEFDWSSAPEPRPKACYAKRVALLSLDFDDVRPEQVQQIRELFAPLEHVLYTTWKHPKHLRELGVWRFRIIAPLTRPLDVATEYDGYARRIYHLLASQGCDGGIDVPVLKDAARGFFGPCVGSQEDVTASTLIHNRGVPLDVDVLLRTPCDFHFPRKARGAGGSAELRPITRDGLERMAKSWARSTSPWKNTLGAQLKQVCNGESFAQPGTIDNSIFALVGEIAKVAPWVSPDSVGEHFAASLQLMAAEHPAYAMTPEQVADKLERAQANAEEAEQEHVQVQEEQERLRIRQAWKLQGVERDTCYTSDELSQFASGCGATSSEFRHRWIIKLGNSVYFWTARGYDGPFARVGGENEAATFLAPAKSCGVKTHEVTQQGTLALRSLSRLVDLYGTTARRGVVDMTATHAHYDATNGEMVEAPFQVDETIRAAYHPEVERWLQQLAHGKFHLLEQWIAYLPRLDHPCVALYIWGPRGVGKSFLAKIASTLWNDRGATPIANVFQDKNEHCLNNPVIFADEVFPEDNRGNPRTGELREWIQRRVTPLRRMYRAPQELRGSFRFVIAANNQTLLMSGGNGGRELTNDDIAAIGERILMIHANPEAKAAVAGITLEQAREHFRWVQQVRAPKMKPAGRFMVQDPDNAIHKALSTRTGVRYSVCEFYVRYLVKPQVVDRLPDRKIFKADGALWVRLDALVEYWESYMPHTKQPRTSTLSRTVRELSCGSRKWFGKTYRQVDSQHLMAWAHDQDILDREEFASLLLVDTPSGNVVAFKHHA